MHTQPKRALDGSTRLDSRTLVRRILNDTRRASIALAVAALATVAGPAACSSDAPLTPLTQQEPTAGDTVHGPTHSEPGEQVHDRLAGFPPLIRPGTIYERVTASTVPGESRYVLYWDSTFSLQYHRPDVGFFQYRGRYSRTGATIVFQFNANAGRWTSTATLADESLSVLHDSAMRAAGFEDGVYQVPSAEPSPYIHIVTFDAVSGVSLVRLTAGREPAWSPDGRKIAFHRDGHVRVIDIDGRNDRVLAAGFSPTWSPDGTRIAFANADGIAVINSEGGSATTLIRNGFLGTAEFPDPTFVAEPSWSPTGTHIAFQVTGDYDNQVERIYVMNADGSNPRNPVHYEHGSYGESDPSWSRDGSKILFWTWNSGISTVPVTGGRMTSIYPEGYAEDPVYSADGSSIAFGKYWEPWRRAIWIVSADGTGARELIPTGYSPAWAPSGNRMAFLSEEQMSPPPSASAMFTAARAP